MTKFFHKPGLILGALLGLIISLGVLTLPAVGQNVSLIGSFYQLSGLGIGNAPAGTTGNIVAQAYSWPASVNQTTATTITVPNGVFHLTGTTLFITTITVPAFCSPTCVISIVPDTSSWRTVAASGSNGNISLASSAVSGKTLIMAWDGTAWNPSY